MNIKQFEVGQTYFRKDYDETGATSFTIMTVVARTRCTISVEILGKHYTLRILKERSERFGRETVRSVWGMFYATNDVASVHNKEV